MKKSKYIKIILLIVFISFLCSYIVCYSGYYEYNLGRKTTIMNDKILEFEKAIKSGKEVDNMEFFKEEEHNYTNRFSNMMYDINSKGDEMFKKILKNFFKKISEFMLED